MNNHEIANILYNMSLDMDYADSIEFAEDEISEIAASLEGVNDSMRECLEMIAAKNESLYDWHKMIGGDVIE